MMERRFDMSNFEQSLKDQADHFDMAPSKRVWRGIYNGIHPGSKWPSATVAIIFIISLVIIGNLNNSSGDEGKSKIKTSQANEINKNSELHGITEEPTAFVETKKSISQTKGFNFLPHSYLFQNLTPRNKFISEIKSDSQSGKDEDQVAKTIDKAPHKKSIHSNSTDKSHISQASTITYTTSYNSINLYNANKKIINNKSLPAQNNILLKDFYQYNNVENVNHLAINGGSQGYIQANTILSLNKYRKAPGALGRSIPKPVFSFAHFVTSGLSLIDDNTLLANASVLQEQDENSLFKRNKKIKKIQWMYYLTPSISTALFRNKEMGPGISLLPNRSFNGMTYKAGLGLEAGAQMAYRLSDNWDFITGANIQYSAYNVVSNLVHPTFATLSFRDKGMSYSKSYITHYGNGITQNKIDLLNYSLQASVPVGLQYHIWQDKKVQINLLSTVDVSALLKSNAFIISSDGRYYVKDPSLSRPVNLGLNFNPNIVLNSKKIKWHLGPEIRYKLLSRYKNTYMVKEHLIDYGIRIGVSK